MEQPRRSTPRRRTTSDPEQTEQQEDAGSDTDHLLEEVQDANAQTPDPAERVIPSRPC